MRLWTLHPQYLDPQGLVALWREALLAQAVLAGATKGYRHHPQLERFASHSSPLKAIGTYLLHVAQDASRRGYAFDSTKILQPGSRIRLAASSGQVSHEASHLTAKLAARSPVWLATLGQLQAPHPMFKIAPGPIASWERTGGA